jgi:signal transduction histidine kinase/CheY-like chemotaxis protein
MSSVVGELLQPAAAIGSYSLDRDHLLVELDATAARLLGRPAQELLGRCLWDVHPELRGGPLHRHYAEILEGGGERRFLFRHEPTDRWYAVAAEPTGSPLHPSGIEVRFGEAGAELGDLRAEIGRQRLDAAAQALGRLAHDMNNCLTVALGNAEFLEEELADRPELLAAVRLITEAAERGAALTGRVLRFARRDRHAAGEVELRPTLEALAARLGAGWPAWPVTLACPPAARAMVDEAELVSVLEELAANARAATPEGGPIRIAVERAPGGERIAVAVEDAGPGLRPDRAWRVIEPFVGEGAGLGLSAVHGFATAHGGTLRLLARERGGTRAVLELPGTAPAVADDRAPGAPQEALTVLLVEDDPVGRLAIGRLLAALGFRVRGAASAAEALESLRDGPEPALLLADVVLPGGLDGVRLAEEARRLRPGLPAVLMSGYAASPPGPAAMAPGGIPLIAKPFRKAALMQALQSALRPAAETAPEAASTSR